jgi:hypothetical protein
MKLPAAAIAASFVSGVILGLSAPRADRATSARFLTAAFVSTCFLIFAGIWLTRAPPRFRRSGFCAVVDRTRCVRCGNLDTAAPLGPRRRARR